VGKTLLTALLLCHLRDQGLRALALKPFCSGTRSDAQLLHKLQDGDLTLDEVNPFYFPEPVAPLISSRKHKRRIPLDQAVKHINSIASRPGKIHRHSSGGSITQNSKLKTQNYVLIEGSGGLLVPLGEGYTVRDLIARLNCEVIVVSRNKLGTINHTLLTIQALRQTPHSALRTPHSALKVVLMGSLTPDPSATSNADILAELLAPVPLISVPFLGTGVRRGSVIARQAHRLRFSLARLLA
jgi:dethiobiotin synthetase